MTRVFALLYTLAIPEAQTNLPVPPVTAFEVADEHDPVRYEKEHM
jgi:hypothetical protein